MPINNAAAEKAPSSNIRLAAAGMPSPSMVRNRLRDSPRHYRFGHAGRKRDRCFNHAITTMTPKTR
ncbi:MAG TPA: hypothetical protein VGA56_17795, partial [Opitutaceae bacterium]